jgi:hydroxyacylglutathione hydrolase
MSPAFDVAWIHGSADCDANSDPALQVHQFDESTYILRQNKCLNFEAPFLYLLFGQSKALLLDTGAQPAPGHELPLEKTVQAITRQWASSQRRQFIELIVAHSHSHNDHVYGDAQFISQPHTRVIRPNLASVRSFFGFTDWPNGNAKLDLGGRMLTVFPIPGHEATHLAIYDAATQILLTGDTLYPGLLTVPDWPTFCASARRLTEFSSANQISFILGAHIEMKRAARELYAVGTTYQPDEHVLQLQGKHILELQRVCKAMGDIPHRDVHADFIIQPLN